jgi:hypothetical protein
MTIGSKLESVGLVARVARHILHEKAAPRGMRVTAPDQVPRSVYAITEEWLSRVLCPPSPQRGSRGSR